MLETWLRLGRISHGPVFRPVAQNRATDLPRCATCSGLSSPYRFVKNHRL
jgi:hypothetical protein